MFATVMWCNVMYSDSYCPHRKLLKKSQCSVGKRPYKILNRRLLQCFNPIVCYTHVIRNAAHAPAQQVSYTAGRVLPNKENLSSSISGASFEGAGGRRPPPNEKEKRKKRKKRKMRKKREKLKKERKKGTMNNVKLLQIKWCFFKFFNSPVSLKNLKKFWPPQEKVEMTPLQHNIISLLTPDDDQETNDAFNALHNIVRIKMLDRKLNTLVSCGCAEAVVLLFSFDVSWKETYGIFIQWTSFV